MQVSWLHVSDFHIRGGDPYDRDVVLKTLVKSVRYFRDHGRAPDLIFATGDIAHGGKPVEYELATKFFDDLLEAANLEKRRLFVIPGNHDVDRTLGVGLARTLTSREDSDSYFNPALPKPHLTQKMGAFLSWHDEYFKGIRIWPRDTSCGPVELAEVRGTKLGILSMNSAFFCQDDEDHNKLLIGRRSLDGALEKLQSLKAELNVALIHHPLDWLNDLERSNIKSALQSRVDFILRGHLHEIEVESVASASGQSLFCVAGAAYQTRKWPNRAMYGALNGKELTIFPIRYEDTPQEVWTVDPSLFPWEQNFEKKFVIARLAAVSVLKHSALSQSIQRLRLFLCHSSGDKPAVRELWRRLKTDGFEPWLDEEELLPGQLWQKEIPAAVRSCDVVIVCLSRSSVTKEGYVQKEIRVALDIEEEKPEGTIFIIPACLEEGVAVPERLTKWQWVNLFEHDGYDRLVRALRRRSNSSSAKGAIPQRDQMRRADLEELTADRSAARRMLEKELEEAMFSAFQEAKRLKYNANRFFQMLTERGGLATAKTLLAGGENSVSDGFTAMWQLNRLDLTVEAICLRERFSPLFTSQELNNARKRLENVGYQGY
jgi:UDP-2,3-diacylglucosamine pyrophosphatase LpxH